MKAFSNGKWTGGGGAPRPRHSTISSRKNARIHVQIHTLYPRLRIDKKEEEEEEDFFSLKGNEFLLKRLEEIHNERDNKSFFFFGMFVLFFFSSPVLCHCRIYVVVTSSLNFFFPRVDFCFVLFIFFIFRNFFSFES